ncbi:centromere protein s [Anaeramoeba flamelloides]|uniref:Centromere protein s n=1 Tax=Anaeramoeba flamelloides TaxID=1746091 RepID=A0AAV8A088_9EUKA|nr:centromere protein s [Anaeramoeba flamelloides]
MDNLNTRGTTKKQPLDFQVTEKTRKLRDSFDHTIFEIFTNEARKDHISVSKIALHTYSHLLYNYLLKTICRDLEQFSSHAGRVTIKPADLLLICRRNKTLHELMRSKVEELTEEKKRHREKTKKKKKKKEKAIKINEEQFSNNFQIEKEFQNETIFEENKFENKNEKENEKEKEKETETENNNNINNQNIDDFSFQDSDDFEAQFDFLSD